MYDDWNESIEVDRKAGRKASSGKRWSYLLKFTTAPTRVHFGHPEKPYTHPDTGRKLPFSTRKRHWIPGGGKKGNGIYIECGDQCVVCAYTNPQAFGLENVTADSRFIQFVPKTYYAVSGWVEDWYHVLEYYIDDKDQSKGTFHRRERCSGRGCELCNDGEEKVFGNRFYANIAPSHWRDAVHDLHNKIQLSHCKCGGAIFIPDYTCVKCNKVLLDIYSTCDCGNTEVALKVDSGTAVCNKCDSSWSAYVADHQHLYEQTREKLKCKSCGHVGLPKPTKVCAGEDVNCPVDPFGVFDCQLVLKMAGTDKTADLLVDGYTIQEPDPRLFDPKCQGTDEWAEKVAESHKNPLDLDFLLAPDSPDVQAQQLGKSNPFGSTTGQASVKYERPVASN